jgi:hypothetical protein
VGEHSDPTSEEDRDYRPVEGSLVRAAQGCWAVVGQELGAVDMVDRRMSQEGTVAIEAGSGCSVAEA